MAPQSKLPERIRQALTLLKPEGSWTRDLSSAMGIPDARLYIVMTAAIAEGKAVMFKAGRNVVYFPTLADANAFEARFVVEEAARLRERKRIENRKRQERHGPMLSIKRRERRQRAALAKQQELAQQRAIAAAERELAKQRARLERETALARKQREKAEAKSQQKALKEETRRLGKLAKLKGTASPAPDKVRGPAHLEGELDLSRAKITRLPAPPERFAPTFAASVVSSRDCRSWAEAVAA